jgi:biopolymer transport protein ExbD
MASSKLAARGIRNHAKYKGRNDLNIVPMIDMMVILVFFLLFTAVFSNTNVLELNLPAPNSSVPELEKGLQLEIIVRQNSVEIATAIPACCACCRRKVASTTTKACRLFCVT